MTSSGSPLTRALYQFLLLVLHMQKGLVKPQSKSCQLIMFSIMMRSVTSQIVLSECRAAFLYAINVFPFLCDKWIFHRFH